MAKSETVTRYEAAMEARERWERATSDRKEQTRAAYDDALAALLEVARTLITRDPVPRGNSTTFTMTDGADGALGRVTVALKAGGLWEWEVPGGNVPRGLLRGSDIGPLVTASLVACAAWRAAHRPNPPPEERIEIDLFEEP